MNITQILYIVSIIQESQRYHMISYAMIQEHDTHQQLGIRLVSLSCNPYLCKSLCCQYLHQYIINIIIIIIIATDCSHTATSILLIPVEVSVKVACWSTTATDCKHRAITMLLILVEVSVKLPYSGGSICESGLAVHEEVSVKVACRSMTATDCGHRTISKLPE